MHKKTVKNFAVKEKSITFAPQNRKESWQSDRSRWTRNPVYPYGYRGFESLTLRKVKGFLM